MELAKRTSSMFLNWNISDDQKTRDSKTDENRKSGDQRKRKDTKKNLKRKIGSKAATKKESFRTKKSSFSFLMHRLIF